MICIAGAVDIELAGVESFYNTKPLTSLLYDSLTVAGTDIELSPISAALARHIGINVTREGLAARNKRGIAIIVHGSPLSGQYFVIILSNKIMYLVPRLQRICLSNMFCYITVITFCNERF